MRFALIAIFVLGCAFTSPAPSVDEVPDEVPDGCFGAIVTICPEAPPTTARMLTGTIDTDRDAACEPSGTSLEACVIAGTAITVMSLRAIGAKPLVLFATTAITVTQTLDVSSPRGGAR